MDPQKLIGKQIGNYVVKRLLGAGGMGAVFVAEHPAIKREVAVKLLAPEMCQDATKVERFITEARVVASLRHRSLIEIYDFGRTDEGQLYYTMEVLDGRDLGQVISERAPMSAAETLPYIEQICAALELIHAQGVVHRDLKPGNIVVLGNTPELRLKLLDFGLAKLLDVDQDVSVTSTGTILGTPVTMAPEQAAGRSQSIGAQTDIYALGVILFWMLAGRPPFASGSPALVVAHHVMQPPPRLSEIRPDVPHAVAALVSECLAKDPLDRPASAAELAMRLAAAIGAPPNADTLPPMAGANETLHDPSANKPSTLPCLVTDATLIQSAGPGSEQLEAYEPTALLALLRDGARRDQLVASVITATLIAVGLVAALIVVAT